MSVAIIPMAKHFGWGAAEKGLVLSSFFLGYLVSQILGGWLANRYGGKIVLGIGVFWWSLFTILTPLAAFISLPVLFLVRVAMGLGEGVAFPAIYNVFSRWVPSNEKSRAVAFNSSGISIGAIAAISVTPWIASELGWPMVFYSFGALGFLWMFFWWILVSSDPSNHRTISEHERNYIRSTANNEGGSESIPWLLLLSKSPVWAIIINHFCINWGLYVLMSWLPSYFSIVLGVELSSVWLYVAPPWICLFIMTNLVGWLADSLIKRGWSTTAVRKSMLTIGMLGPAVFLMMVTQVETAPQAVMILSAAISLVSFAFAGFAPNHLDIAPRYADILFGISNTAGTIPGIIGVALTGWLIEATGSYASAFQLAALVYVIGAVVWLLFATGERIID